MPRATWSGSVSFGLVNVPIKLYGAVREKRVRFNQIEADTGARIRYRRVSEETGEEVPYENILKGYEIAKDRYVPVTEEELEAAAPEASRTVDIVDFVDLVEIDPVYFDRTYYLEPDGRGAHKPYALLVQAMHRTGKVAIGRFVMRTREYLATIRAVEDVLVLETMHFPDEVVDPGELDIPRGVELADRELDTADRLVESLSVKWDPDRYHDTYRERVLELVERKAEGEEILARPQAEEEPEVVDLMAALEASLEERSGSRS